MKFAVDEVHFDEVYRKAFGVNGGIKMEKNYSYEEMREIAIDMIEDDIIKYESEENDNLINDWKSYIHSSLLMACRLHLITNNEYNNYAERIFTENRKPTIENLDKLIAETKEEIQRVLKDIGFSAAMLRKIGKKNKSWSSILIGCEYAYERLNREIRRLQDLRERL